LALSGLKTLRFLVLPDDLPRLDYSNFSSGHLSPNVARSGVRKFRYALPYSMSFLSS